ncbi:PAS-domain containing protein [Shinella pollutisoli]|uniref:histidine kinase n=1 Tax=Shinella pollutisoli TaxID=2250594 RepID=A0ABV7DLQ0_9HYPH
MVERQDELLAAISARVREHPHPAYAKTGDLRYLVVNAAYARLFGREPDDMTGLCAADAGMAPGFHDIDERERRCLIFGGGEQVRHDDGFDVLLRRERLSGDCTVLTGLFVPAAANANPRAESPGSAVEEALDAMGAGVAVFDAGNRLRYANASMRDFYRQLVGARAEGPVELREIVDALYDLETCGAPDEPRAAWIAARLEHYELPLFESVSRTPTGWMRLVTQRRPDRTLVALRVDVTALKEHEGRLREHSQEISLYRALLDELPVASFVRDEAMRLVFANRAFMDLTGRTADDLIGRTPTESYPGQGRELQAYNQSVLDTGKLLQTETSFRRPDGTLVPTISRISRVTTLDERHYLIGSVTDTTVLRKREDQLIEARREAESIRSDLESIVESLPVGIVVVDEMGTIELVNGAFQTLWAGALPAMKGRPFGELLRFQEQQGGTCGEGEAPCGGQCFEERLCSIRAGALPVREVAYANGRTLIEAGAPISGGRCLLTYIDITERREREREVLETRSALEEVGSLVKDAVSSMSQGLLIIEDGRVVLSNEALSNMIAMPPHLLQPGTAVSDILQDCIDRGVCGYVGERLVEAEEFDTVLLTGETVSLTLFSGRERWVRLDVTPTSRGRNVLVFTDITDLKNREEELRRLVVRAETADKAKSEFLANMSHEIRTPMNGVLGMAELLAKSSLDTRQKTFIDIMVKSGNALLTIINDILDFSKIDAGQMVLRDVAFSPVEAIEDVATLLSAKAAEKDIELVVRGAAQMPAAVMGDAGRFRQIVTNLVGNAVKFTDRGHVLIELAAGPLDDGRVEVVIRVEDTGAGIPADKMASIFEKFSQVDTSSTRRHEGTGLGLAITDGLTRLFGGTLSAESEVGAGSVFTVRLPMALASAALPPRLAAAPVPGARVLVVDPHPVARKAAHDLLGDWGFDATAVGSFAEALAVLAAAADVGVRVDAVIFDHQPGGDAFVRTLRQSPATADVSLVVLTSMNLPAGDRLLASHDIQAHLMKPVRANLLRETVAEVVRAARGHKTAQPARAPSDNNVLPLRPPAAHAAPQAAAGCDVLVAEDNEVNQILFTQLLEGLGLSFRLVGNGAEAVEAFRSDRPRVVLMDISMPVMNGLQASRAIREIESGSGSRVPIIAVTAHALDEDREACRAAGMDDHLTKPISIDRLEEKLTRWLKREKAAVLAGQGI